MKDFFRRLLKRIKNFFKWLWAQLKDWRTLVIFIIVLLVMYFPAYGFYILSGVFGNGWFAAAATAYVAFWAGPFTPFFPLCIAITLAVKRIIFKIKVKKNKTNDPAAPNTANSADENQQKDNQNDNQN